MLHEGTYARHVFHLIARQVEDLALACYGEKYHACDPIIFMNHHQLDVSGGRHWQNS